VAENILPGTFTSMFPLFNKVTSLEQFSFNPKIATDFSGRHLDETTQSHRSQLNGFLCHLSLMRILAFAFFPTTSNASSMTARPSCAELNALNFARALVSSSRTTVITINIE
jgi:hypothetical protein